MDDVVALPCLACRQGAGCMFHGEDEKIDDVFAPPVHDRCYRPVVQIVESSANQGKSCSAEVLYRGRKIESAVEPRLDLMLIRRKHIGQMIGRQRTQMVVNDLTRR